MRRASANIALLLFAIWAPLSPAQKPDTLLTVDAVVRDYARGDVVGAIRRLERIIGSKTTTEELEPFQLQLRLLLDICDRARDGACVSEWAPRFAEVLLSNKPDSPLLERTFTAMAGYYIALWAELDGEPESVQHALSTYLEWPDDIFIDHEFFIRRQLLAARLYLLSQERVLARRAIDRAMASLLSIKDPEGRSWLIAVLLVDTLHALVELGDVERATGLLLASGDFIAQSLSPTSIDYVRYRYVESSIAAHALSFQVAHRSAIQARDAMTQLKLPLFSTFLLTYEVNLQLAYAAMISVDRKNVDAALSALEQLIDLRELRRTKRWVWQGQIPVVALRMLHRASQSIPADQHDLALLRQEGIFDTLQKWEQIFDGYRKIGLLIAETSHEDMAPTLDFRDVIRDYLSLFRQHERYTFDVFPQPSSVDRLVAIILLTLLARDATTNPVDIDMAISLADIATRTSQTLGSDTYTLLGRTRSVEERRLLHQGLRLASRRNRYEAQEVQRLVTAAAVTSTQHDFIELDYNTRSTFGDFASQISRARDYFSVHTPELNTASLLLQASDIRSVLLADEAVFVLAPLDNTSAALICMRSTGGVIARTVFNPEELQGDLRLLSNSVTASHQVDESLDRQFPAASAVRSYNTLVAPIEGCLRDTRVVFVAAPPQVIPVPFSALLRSMPARLGEGYDLGNADWLVRHYSVAYVGTPAALVASRRRASSGELLPFRFLGVGDPELNVTLPSGERGIDVVAGGTILSADGDPADLIPLPETRDELNDSALRVGSPATILVGKNASEGQLRRQPLSQYRYLSFATHGLIREEIPGLRESALVLTPVNPADSYNDGLLTASEIADLSLGADFVALSACNTANFDLTDTTADVPGLATAFAIAGTPATLATLWPVDSVASKSIVESVFELLGDGVVSRPAEALARAQVSFLAAHVHTPRAHPRYWAPFVQFGDSVWHGQSGSQTSGAVVVTNTKTLTEKSGEILGATIMASGQLFLTGIGEWNGSRFAATRVAVDRELAVNWKSDSYDIGGTSLAVVVNGAVLTGGYRWGGPENPVATPVLQTLSEDGSTLREITIDTPGYSSVPAAAIATNDGGVLVAVLGSKITEDIERNHQVFLYRLSRELDIVSRASFAVPASGATPSAHLAKSGDSFLLAIVDELFHSPIQPLSVGSYNDELLNPRVCFATPQTWLNVIDAATLDVSPLVSLSDVSIKQLVSDRNGVLVAAGSTSRCDGRRQAAIWKISHESAGLEVLYQEDAILDSESTGVASLADGRIVLVGWVRRPLDVGHGDERLATSIADDTYTRVSFTRTEARDLLVAVIDEASRPTHRSFLAFGSDAIGNRVLEFEGRLLVAGAVGNEASLIELSLPPASNTRH